MLFSYQITFNHYNGIDTKLRKENDSLAHRKNQNTLPNGERASVSASLPASLTVEASLAVPMFFFAILCFCFLLEMMAVQFTVRQAAREACKRTAEEAYRKPVLLPAELEAEMVRLIGGERLNRSMLVGGAGGLDCSGSRMSAATGMMDVSVKYKVKLPISFFGTLAMELEEHLRAKGWNGYAKTWLSSEEEETVYVTDTGVVYHKNYHCTYLELSIQMVEKGEVESLRNEDGGKYNPCELCGAHGTDGVYITATGDKYHSSLGCSGLKRSVYAIPISEAVGKGVCSRCANS